MKMKIPSSTAITKSTKIKAVDFHRRLNVWAYAGVIINRDSLDSHSHTTHFMKASLIRLLGIGALGCVLTLSSCVNPYAGPNERNGTVYGALGGAALGGIIGSQSRRGLEGAAIGGVLGALAGQQLGQSRDRSYFIGGSRYGYPSSYRYTRGYSPTVYSRSYSPAYYGRSYSPYRYGSSRYSYNRFGTGLGFGSPFGIGSSFGLGRGFGGYCW